MNMPEQQKKIKLDTIEDLQRLSFTEIKNLPLSKCTGALFETALQQAIQLEKDQSVGIGPYQKFIQKYHPKAFDIKFIVFQTTYQTDVRVVKYF